MNAAIHNEGFLMPTLPSAPSGPCIPGTTLLVQYTCGEGATYPENPTLLDSDEIGAGEPELLSGIAATAAHKPCGGCKSEILAAFQLGADTFKAGMEYERARSAKS